MLARFSVLVIHRRAGKTLIAILKLVDEALRCTKRDGRFGYVMPELKQGKDVVWSYLKHYATKVPGTKVNESELSVRFPNGAMVRIYGSDNIDAFRGVYFDGLVLDEVAQMNKNLWGSVLFPTLTDRRGWAIFIGTPGGIDLFSETYFGAVSGEKVGWAHCLMTVYDTGVFTPAEIEEIRKQMFADTGSDNAFQREFMCSFDVGTDNTLISTTEVTTAFERVLAPGSWEYAPRIIGVDVSWGKTDRSVIALRQGFMLFEPHEYYGLPEKDLTLKVATLCESWRPDAVFVDTTGGYGGEVLSRLQETGHAVQGVVFSQRASTRRFLNIRSEMWFKMAQWIREGACLPKSAEWRRKLTLELCAARYTNDNVANRFVLESKDDIRERIRMSPDIADAISLSFAFPVATRHDNLMSLWMAGRSRSTDFDPHGRVGGDFDPLR